jgi:diguanylate cyclase (GGDEF)-like protein
MHETKPAIVVANGSAAWRSDCRRALGPLPARIVETADAPGTLLAARGSDVALIVLDARLPDLPGAAVAERLRRDARTAATPVILVDAAGFDVGRLRDAYRAGAVDCLMNMPAESDLLRHKAGVFVELCNRRLLLERAIRRAARSCARLKERQQAAWREATHDALTGLPNRLLFDDRLDQSLKRATRARRCFAVGFMDLDGFKAVNDCYGHAAGDELLTAVAARLQRALRGTDTVARIGGDEFALLFADVSLAEACRSLRHKLRQAICEPLTLAATLDGAPARIVPRASIGIALYPDHAGDRPALLRLADVAMYAAKRAGGGVCLCGGPPPGPPLPGALPG